MDSGLGLDLVLGISYLVIGIGYWVLGSGSLVADFGLRRVGLARLGVGGGNTGRGDRQMEWRI